MTTNLYLLIPQSNLHVGAGSSNYGVIDNLVQRDAIDQYPNIHASSLKGALREFYEEVLGWQIINANGKKEPDARSKTVFGGADEGKGKCVFSEGHLLGLPVRSNKKPYFMATSPYVLKKFLILAKEYGYELDATLETEINALATLAPANERPIVINGLNTTGLKIEDLTQFTNHSETLTKLTAILGTDIVVFSDEDFSYQCGDYALPVLARNHLENGISQNLWYEQVVPRLARFYFTVDDYTTEGLFDSILPSDKLVQVGGNATVGYGRCKITNLNTVIR